MKKRDFLNKRFQQFHILNKTGDKVFTYGIHFVTFET